MPLRRLALTAAAALALAAPAYALAHRSAAKPAVLVAKVGKGNGFTITLTKAGRPVQGLKPKLKAGSYTIVVHDYSAIHNFRIKGPRLNRATTIPEVVDTTWRVNLRKGVYTVVCDPHVVPMRFTFRVT